MKQLAKIMHNQKISKKEQIYFVFLFSKKEMNDFFLFLFYSNCKLKFKRKKIMKLVFDIKNKKAKIWHKQQCIFKILFVNSIRKFLNQVLLMVDAIIWDQGRKSEWFTNKTKKLYTHTHTQSTNALQSKINKKKLN